LGIPLTYQWAVIALIALALVAVSISVTTYCLVKKRRRRQFLKTISLPDIETTLKDGRPVE
jgi:hypothetical protein